MKNISGSGSAAYAKAGVNLTAGDAFSAFAGRICKESFRNSSYVKVHDHSVGHFRGPRGFEFINLPEGFFQMGAPDGIGTATIIVSAAGAHHTSSSRLLAMTAGDITRYGGLPLVLFNVLEAKTLGMPDSELFKAYQRMMLGLGDYAIDQGIVLMGGETAEMNDCVSSEIVNSPTMPVYNWSGIMIGVGHPDKIITGKTLKPGQHVIALVDKLRSNGGSLMRKYLREFFGKKWWQNPKAKELIIKIASPAKLYDKFLSTMNGWHNCSFTPVIKMHAIAHISGGGIRTKFFEDVLRRLGHSAVLENLPIPPTFMSDCVDKMGINDEEAYQVLNGGVGALVVVGESDADEFCRLASLAGFDTYNAGFIDKKHRIPRLKMHSKFGYKWITMK